MSSERHIALCRPLTLLLFFPLPLLISNCATPETTAPGQTAGMIAAAPIAAPDTPPETAMPPPEPVMAAPPQMTPQKVEPRPQRAGPPPRPRPRGPQDAGTLPGLKPPPVVPADLVGSDYAAVLRVLRRPDVIDTNTLSVVWTYSESACTVQLFFYPDIETAKYHLLKFDLKDGKGERLANSTTCMQRIAIMRNDE